MPSLYDLEIVRFRASYAYVVVMLRASVRVQGKLGSPPANARTAAGGVCVAGEAGFGIGGARAGGDSHLVIHVSSAGGYASFVRKPV